jgi:hypothetical protein
MTAPMSPIDHYNEGKRLAKAGAWAEAVASFGQALAADAGYWQRDSDRAWPASGWAITRARLRTLTPSFRHNRGSVRRGRPTTGWCATRKPAKAGRRRPPPRPPSSPQGAGTQGPVREWRFKM